MKPRLYVEAIRSARPEQLRARALRPLQRRRFPRPRGGRSFGRLDVPLWRTQAYDEVDTVAEDGAVELLGKWFPFPPPDWQLAGEPRLRRFHLHYGDEILGWARRGDGVAARAGISAWIDGNPPRRGDAWHPYPLSTRVANWLAALSLEPSLATTHVLESISRQLAHLQRNIEHDVLGNHVVRNARALVLGGLAFGDRELREQGEALLRREVPEQVLGDGGHYERSPAYHLIVLRDLMEVRAAADLEWLDEPITRMTRFAAALSRPDGRPALFNDGALDLAPNLELPAAPDGLALFPDSGYAVLREAGVWLAFDFGLPSPPFLPAHAHADALSFQLWVDGRAIVVDPGAFTYEPGVERTWFRSTRAHSTVEVAGRSQFETWGAFRAGPLPQPVLVAAEPLEAEVTLGEVVVRRRLHLRPDELVVEDELDGRGSVAVSSNLPLGTTVAVAETGGLGAAPAVGWLSERMLERAAITGYRAEGVVRLPASLGWRIGLRSAT